MHKGYSLSHFKFQLDVLRGQNFADAVGLRHALLRLEYAPEWDSLYVCLGRSEGIGYATLTFLYRGSL